MLSLLVARMWTAPEKPSDNPSMLSQEEERDPFTSLAAASVPSQDPVVLKVQSTASEDSLDPLLEDLLNGPFGCLPDESLESSLLAVGVIGDSDNVHEAMPKRTKQKLDPINAEVCVPAAADAVTIALETRVQLPQGRKRKSYRCGKCGKQKENHICEVTGKRASFDAWSQTPTMDLEEGGSESRAHECFHIVVRTIGTWFPVCNNHGPSTRNSSSHQGSTSSSIAHAIWTLLRLSELLAIDSEGNEGRHDQQDTLHELDEEEYGGNIAQV